MSLVDYALIAIVGVSTVIALWRGFVREAISLTGLIIAFLLASRLSADVGAWFSDWVSNPSIQSTIGFALIFILTVIVFAIVGRLCKRFINAVDLTSTDRLLGMLFGLGRGVLLIVVGVLLLKSTMPEKEQWLQKESTLGPYAISLSNTLARAIPKDHPFSTKSKQLAEKMPDIRAMKEKVDGISAEDRKALQNKIEELMQ